MNNIKFVGHRDTTNQFMYLVNYADLVEIRISLNWLDLIEEEEEEECLFDQIFCPETYN